VYQAIDNYLTSKNYYSDSKDGASYGIEALQRYMDYLHKSKGRRIDLRNSRLLAENKKVFFNAIQRLPSFRKISNRYVIDKIYSGYAQHQYLAIKYNLSEDISDLMGLVDKLKELIEAEKRILKIISR
jgi:hypothetical protein